MVKDITGKKTLPAKTVFTAVIRVLKDELLESLKDRTDRFGVEDILFVITVPAIWTDTAKKFMKEAAVEVIYPLLSLRKFMDTIRVTDTVILFSLGRV